MKDAPRKRMPLALKLPLLLLGGYVLLVVIGRLAARSILYPAPRRGFDAAAAKAELVSYPTSDGLSVNAAVYGPSKKGPVIVYFHGNGAVIADSVQLAHHFVRLGFGFIAAEYRGYGGTPGHPTEDNLYADAETLLVGLGARGITSDRIALWGSSLGTGVAVEMARRGYASRLILQAPYTAIPAVAGGMIPFLPMSFIMADHYDNLAKAKSVTLPTLILHGQDDRIVPHAMGETLAASFPNCSFESVPKAGHNDLFVVAGPRVLGAMETHLRGPAAAQN